MTAGSIHSSIPASWEALTRGPVAEKFALILFLFTCINAAFLWPDITLVLGERSKLFTGSLCTLSLLATVVLVKQPSRFGTWPELAISVILLILAIISGILSSTPKSSLYRGFVVMGSGLGGFWCARILVQCPARQEFFKWFCVVLLAAIVCLSVLGYEFWGSVQALLDDNPHPLACRILLLSFAPLALILTRNRPAMILGGLILCLCYLVFYLSSLRSASLIPLVLAVVAVWTGMLRMKYFLLLLIPFVLIIACFFCTLPSVKIGPEYEPAYYRAENYPFSWHVAVKHPFFGIGLRAPRDEYIKDYQVKYPYATKEKFEESLNRIVSSENTFLSFMVDLGFPFLIIYCLGGSVLLIRLVRMVKNPRPGIPLPPLALLLSIVAGLLHFQVLDGLLHPQVSWFFHILLGLIPVPSSEVDGVQTSGSIDSFVQSIK